MARLGLVVIFLGVLIGGCATVDQQVINRELATRKNMTIEQRLEKLERESLELQYRLGVVAGDAGAATGIAIGSGIW